MKADVKKEGTDLKNLKPEPKYVLFSQGKIRVYQPKPDQVTEIDLGKNRADRKLSGAWLWRQRTGSGQILRRDLCRSGDHRRRGHGQAELDSQVGEGAQHLPSRFFCGSIWSEESRCSSNSLRRKGITAWPSTPTFRSMRRRSPTRFSSSRPRARRRQFHLRG